MNATVKNVLWSQRLLVATFVFAVIFISWNEITVQKEAPKPARFVWAGVAWGILGVLSALIGPEIPGVFSIGLVLAILYQHYKTPNTPAPQVGGPGKNYAQ